MYFFPFFFFRLLSSAVTGPSLFLFPYPDSSSTMATLRLLQDVVSHHEYRLAVHEGIIMMSSILFSAENHLDGDVT